MVIVCTKIIIFNYNICFYEVLTTEGLGNAFPMKALTMKQDRRVGVFKELEERAKITLKLKRKQQTQRVKER